MFLLSSRQYRALRVLLSSCLLALLAACVRPAPITPFPTVNFIGTPTPILMAGDIQTGVDTPTPTKVGESAPIASATPVAPQVQASYPAYLPFIEGGYPAPPPSIEIAQQPTATPAPIVPTATVVEVPALPTLDFTQIQTEVEAQGRALALSKMGFHTGIGGNITGLSQWMLDHDDAGVPFFLKSADNAGPLFEGQQLAQASGVDHTLIFRRTGDLYDTPNYDLPPQQAAEQHWILHRTAFPPELDPSLVWIETINEVDKGRSEWMAEFAIHTAELAWADGFKWAAFGWSSGEPEPEMWEGTQMLQFLRLAGDNRERLAVALHEYSYINADIADAYPYKVGRFQLLFDVVDSYNIPRPTVLITEWGWEYASIPPVGQAMADIEWAAAMYAGYPQIKGAAIWYLGIGYSDIADETQRLIMPVRNFNLGNYFAVPRFGLFIDPAQHQP